VGYVSFTKTSTLECFRYLDVKLGYLGVKLLELSHVTLACALVKQQLFL
jgi:hypothetical protein